MGRWQPRKPRLDQELAGSGDQPNMHALSMSLILVRVGCYLYDLLEYRDHKLGCAGYLV